MVTEAVRVLRMPVVSSTQEHRQAMEEEARRLWLKSIRETGASPLWWKLMRNPKFRAAVEAEDRRIYLESLDEIVKRRATELGLLQRIEEEYQARLRAPGRQLAAKLPENLGELLKKLQAERETGSTYGAEAEHRQFEKQFRKARERGDRLVLLGKWSGRRLKQLLQVIYPEIDLSGLQDHVNYGGDLMIIGLERREFESWIRHLSLWGMNQDTGLLTKTVQMKWGETSDPKVTLHQITYAGVQLSGSRDECALPFGHREISIGVLNPQHPWCALDNTNAASVLLPAIHDAFAQGNHGTGENTISVPRGGLYPFVTRVVIRTSDWTFRFTVSGTTITLVSSTRQPGQHRSLVALPRPGKGVMGAQEGTLVCTGPGKYFIQGERRKFTLSATEVLALNAAALLAPGAKPTSLRVVFSLGASNAIISLRKK
jgi:hypothetical protein